nr:immunoglobulin light chain junction region [Macaca mulatta]
DYYCQTWTRDIGLF